MALVANGGNVYTQSGAAGGVGLHNREDLGDFITNIAPTDTPFLSGIGQTKAKAVSHEWLEHTLAAAAGTGALEGEAAATNITPTVITRHINYTQINQKTVAISGTQEKVNKAGMGGEMAYRVLLHTKEIKRDMESAALTNTVGALDDGGLTTARAIKGFLGWAVVNTATVTTGVTLTEAHINLELQNCWTAGGNPDCIIVGGNLKKKISSMTAGVQKNLDANDRRLVSAVDVYESDFGVLKVIPDRFAHTQYVHISETDLWKTAILRPLEVSPLAKDGDYTRNLINIEWTLECRAPSAHGAILSQMA